MFCNLIFFFFLLLANSCFLFWVYCDRFCWSLYYSHSTNHAGVIMCCRHVSPSTNVTYNVMISDVYTNYYFNEFWREADENLQTWICKKKGCWNWVCTHFYYGLTNVMFCHHSHQSACSKKADGWLPPGLEWTATLMFVSERKSFETDVNVSQITTLLLLHFPSCVWSKVMILNFISCGLILEVQDNLRCRNSSFSHFIMFWLKTFYIHFSQFVWCSCTQFKINACLKRYRLLLCGSCYTRPCNAQLQQNKSVQVYFTMYLYLHLKTVSA